MRQSKKKRGTPVLLFTEYVKVRARGKREQGKLSTAELYEVAGRHFERFLKGRTCRIKEVTATLIADFHCFLQRQRLRTNSINSYLSSLRAVYNAALSEGLVAVRENPFARLRLKREETVKRAISAEAIRKMATLDLRKRPELERAADLSLFSFMAFGMPFVDIVNLRKENIRDGEIVYNRHKTGTQIRISITAGIEVLVRKYENDTPFVFDLGQEALGRTDNGGYKRLLSRQNRALREIGERHLGLKTKLTSYVTRHTWASEALAHHVPVAVISQALGHSSEKTTRCYLSQLDQSELDRANKQITEFLDNLLAGGKGTYLRNKSRLIQQPYNEPLTTLKKPVATLLIE